MTGWSKDERAGDAPKAPAPPAPRWINVEGVPVRDTDPPAPIAHRDVCHESYPCEDCGKTRTKAEGGTTFTVCDECWDKRNPPAPVSEPPIEWHHLEDRAATNADIATLWLDRSKRPEADIIASLIVRARNDEAEIAALKAQNANLVASIEHLQVCGWSIEDRKRGFCNGCNSIRAAREAGK